MKHPLYYNLLVSRFDMEEAAAQLLKPLPSRLLPGKGGLRLGENGSVYPQAVADMEGFARILWAIVPMLMGKCRSIEFIWPLWREGILHGVDPLHPEYWGSLCDNDQRMVEMAAIGAGMCLIPDRFFFSLPEDGQNNLYCWLNQINLYDMPVNNWRFFRVLVNTGFRICGLPFAKSRLDEDFALIEKHYEGNGWYYDYFTQREYYTPWAYHYYGLIYAIAMDTLDPERASCFRERAALFAPRFACWFDCYGAALPYGRSLTYRFAQGAFWSIMALAEIIAPGLGLGEIKGLLLRNLRWWFHQPILTGDGVLSIGYGYPNLLMAEGYNAPGSPYWAMKAFAALALPESHPFWQVKEAPYTPPSRLADPHAPALIVRNSSNTHVQAFYAGNHATQHMLDEAKYEKFVYSTHFAFSVPKGLMCLNRGAFDCMLALSEEGLYWRPRYGCQSFAIEDRRVVSDWSPFTGVLVHTEIYPLNEWHIRVHHVRTARALQAAEGGFALKREEGSVNPHSETDPDRCVVWAAWGTSGIIGLRGYTRAQVLVPEPNTNILYPRTLLPTLYADLPVGETMLICAVLGCPEADERAWREIPTEVVEYASMG